MARQSALRPPPHRAREAGPRHLRFGNLLLVFALFTLALFLIFYRARMMTDLLRGWQMMRGKPPRDRDDEPKPPLFDRWAERLDARQQAKAAAA